MTDWIDRWPRVVSSVILMERGWMPALAGALGICIYNDWLVMSGSSGDVALMFCMSVWVVAMKGGFDVR